MNRADLMALKIKMSRTCIILSAKVNLIGTCLLGWYFSLSINPPQVPEKAEPAFADKEIIMAALNIKSMDFNSDAFPLNGEEKAIPLTKSSPNSVTLLLDLAFSTNVRYLDDHEMYLTNIELYKTLPFF